MSTKGAFGKRDFDQMIFLSQLTQSNTFNQYGFVSNYITKLIGAGVRDSCRITG
ncbi:hypothetical protein RCO48_21595 [Peribacillus frigoritolerans]|nr:hypothetical protein [Peribacillus frigoritolerans]